MCTYGMRVFLGRVTYVFSCEYSVNRCNISTYFLAVRKDQTCSCRLPDLPIDVGCVILFLMYLSHGK